MISIRITALPMPPNATFTPAPEPMAWLQRFSNFPVPRHPALVFRRKAALMGTHYRADSLIGAGVCFGTIMVLYLLVVMLFG